MHTFEWPIVYERVFLANPDHGIVEPPILDANSTDFYGTTTLNLVVGRYGI